MNATYTKLKDGSWGLRGAGLTAGARVTVTTKAGVTKTETVGRVLWTGNGISIATIAAAARTSRRNYSRRNEDDECELCGKNKYTCGHCIGW